MSNSDNLNQIVQTLLQQFGGQSVLYVRDLAIVLGKSEKALQHLIHRERFPFSLKSIGGKRCADIYQLAAWLCHSGDDDECGFSNASVTLPNKSDGSKRASGTPSSRQSLSSKLTRRRLDLAKIFRQEARFIQDKSLAEFVRDLGDSLMSEFGVKGLSIASESEYLVEVCWNNIEPKYVDGLSVEKYYERSHTDVSFEDREQTSFDCLDDALDFVDRFEHCRTERNQKDRIFSSISLYIDFQDVVLRHSW